jgi:hypothetical protein
MADPRVDPSAYRNSAIRRASAIGHAEVVKVLAQHPQVAKTFSIMNISLYPVEVRPYIQKFCVDKVTRAKLAFIEEMK